MDVGTTRADRLHEIAIAQGRYDRAIVMLFVARCGRADAGDVVGARTRRELAMFALAAGVPVDELTVLGAALVRNQGKVDIPAQSAREKSQDGHDSHLGALHRRE